jgi:uncharacterized cupin superfamily protein
MPKVDIGAIEPTNQSTYPDPYKSVVKGSWKRRVGRAAGFTELGATHVTLQPGAWSSQRHWHEGEDELLVILSGEAVLIENEGRTILRAGDICAWPKGQDNGHHLINESAAECSFIAVSAGNRLGRCTYSDIDLMVESGRYTHKDGTPYSIRQPG